MNRCKMRMSGRKKFQKIINNKIICIKKNRMKERQKEKGKQNLKKNNLNLLYGFFYIPFILPLINV